MSYSVSLKQIYKPLLIYRIFGSMLARNETVASSEILSECRELMPGFDVSQKDIDEALAAAGVFVPGVSKS